MTSEFTPPDPANMGNFSGEPSHRDVSRLSVEKGSVQTGTAASYFAFLAEASALLSSSLDYQTTLASVVRLTVPHLADCCLLFQLEADGQIQPIATAHYQSQQEPLVQTLAALTQTHIHNPKSLTAQVLRTGKSVLVASVLVTEASDEKGAAITDDPEVLEVYQQLNPTSGMIVPLTARGQVMGAMLLLATDSRRHYGQDDLSLAEELAGRAAIAIDNAQLYWTAQQARAAAEKAAERTARLQAVTTALSSLLTPNQVADVIVEQGIAILQADAALVVLLDERSNMLEIVSQVGYDPERTEQWRRFSLDTPFPLAEAIRTRQVNWAETLAERIERYPHLAQIYTNLDYQAWISLPLMLEERVVGGLSLSFVEAHPVSEDDRTFMLALAQQCAQAIDRAQLYEAEQTAQIQSQIAQQQISNILESITDAFVAVDQEWRYTYVNAEAARLTGLSPDAMLGRKIWDIFPSAIDSVFYQEVHRALLERISIQFESLYEPLNSWFAIRVYPTGEGLAIYFQDVSDRKSAEESLRQSEERLNMALKSAPIALFSQDRDLRYTWIHNPVLGYAVGEVLGKRDEDLLPESVATVLTQIKGRVLVTGVGVREEVKVAYQDQLIYFDLIVEPLYSPEQEVIGITCASVDITERKTAEEALRSSEERLQLACHAARLGTFEWNIQTNEVFWSEEEEMLYGLPPGGFGGVYERWRQAVHPDDRHQAEQAVLQAAASGTELDTEFRIVRPDGSIRWLSAKALTFCDRDGEPLRMIGVSEDITERKQAEAEREQLLAQLEIERSRFEAVLQQMPGGVVIAEAPTGRLILANQQVAQLLKQPIDPSRVMENYQQYDGFHVDGSMYQPEEWPISRSLLHGEVVQNEDIEIRFNDGDHIIIRGNSAPILNQQGEIVAGVVTFYDVTEQKRIEREREDLLQRERTAREAAESANRIKDEFLAVLSHELRSPLNPILGWAKLLRSRSFDPQTTDRALETIERNAKLQTQLIEDLLDVSRILRGKMALNINQVNLAEMIEAALETVNLSAEAKGIQISTQLTADVGPVYGDAGRLQQILWNLLSNAIKFTPVGGQVSVSLKRTGNEAEIQVKDTGKGISPDFLPHVFEYFRQADGTTTRQFGGLGLGLAIVHHLTEMHGGYVQAESPGLDQGATFTVRFPLAQVSFLQEAKSEAQSAVLPPSLTLKGLNILVVEDETDIRELLAFILQQYGAETQVASSASEALEAIDQRCPDVLLSDIGMPTVDGYMLMQQIRQRSPSAGGTIPAIALTAYAGDYNQQQALAAGFQLHLSKPVVPEQLVKAIAQLLARPSSGNSRTSS